MSSVSNTLPFQTIFSDEVNLHILSFLGKRDLQGIASTCKRLEALSHDFQIWKPKTEFEFGKLIADGAKQSNKSWKQTYAELQASRITRVENAAEVIQKHVKKTTTDDLQYRTSRAAAALFGFAMPNPSTHYYPTGQTGYLGKYKITFFRNANQ